MSGAFSESSLAPESDLYRKSPGHVETAQGGAFFKSGQLPTGLPICSARSLGLALRALADAAALLGVKDALAQAQELRRGFDEFVGLDVLDRAL